MTEKENKISKRYPVRPIIRIVTMLVFIASILVALIFNTYMFNLGVFKIDVIDDFLWFVLIVNLFIVFVAWVSGEITFSTSLVLTENGIRYHYLGMTSYTSWTDVTRINYVQMPRGYFEWILSLNKPIKWQNAKSKFIAKLNRNHSHRYIPLGSFVSLPQNVEGLRKTTFFVDLIQFAPHLSKIEELDEVQEETLPDIETLSDEMRQAHDFALSLQSQGKNFQFILAALRENTSLDFDERIVIMDLLDEK